MVNPDQSNLSELIEQHYSVLYRYAFRLSGSVADAEDLTQQTFLTAQQKLKQLRQPDQVRGWLFTILRNHFLKSVRRKSEVPLLVDDPVTTDADVSDQEIESEQLQAALAELTEDFRIPIVLYYFNDFSYRQIADQLGIPVGTVMSRLSRGKRWLRNRLAASVSLARQG